MKMLSHPNIVNLIEVIDDPNFDHFYMGIYVLSIHKLALNFIIFLRNCSLVFFMTRMLTLFSSVLEYVEGKWVCDGSGPPGVIGEKTARKYLRDIVSGLVYLHAHVWFRILLFLSLLISLP